jgi:hypothetical protein
MYFQQLFNQAIQSVATSYHSLGILPQPIGTSTST